MRIPPKAKLEKLASKDASRPVLTHLYLRVVEDATGRRGYLEGTDSYKLGRIPVELDDTDTEGFIPVDAITTARKLKADTIACNGNIRVQGSDGVTAEFERRDIGKFPDTDSLMDIEPALYEGETWRIGLNPLFLLELAMAFGAETVTLEFARTRPDARDSQSPTEFGPSNLRPITVRPQNMLRGAEPNEDAIGLLMPVRSR